MKQISRFPFFFLLPIVLIVVIQLGISLRVLTTDPPIFPDEAFFVNVAEHIKTEKMSVMTLSGTTGMLLEKRVLSYPPLFLRVLSLVPQKIPGSIEGYRLVSVSISVAVLVLLYSLIYFLTGKYWLSFTISILFLLSSQFQMASRITRMEILVVSFFLASLVFLQRFLVKNDQKLLILSCVFSIAAVFTHPIGIVSCISLMIIVFFHSKKSALTVFLLLTVLGLTSFILWIGNDWILFITQLQSFFLYKANRPMLLPLLIENNLVWTIYIVILSGISLIGTLDGFKKKNAWLLGISLSYFFTLILVAVLREQWYLVYLPVLPLISSALLIRSRPKIFVPIFVTLFCIHGQWFASGTANALRSPFPYEQYGKKISAQIPKNSTVVISALPDPYFVLKKRSDLVVSEAPSITTKESVRAFLATQKYAVVSGFSNAEFKDYVTNHAESVTKIDSEGYSLLLIELTQGK